MLLARDAAFAAASAAALAFVADLAIA